VQGADLAGMLRRLALLAVLAALSLGALAPAAQASWSPVGGALNVDPTKDAVSPSIATVGGVPYVAWREGTGLPGLVRVARWSGSGWTAVGGVLNVDRTRNAFLPQIVDVGGTPWAVWEETNGAAYQVRVRRWDGSAWVSVGGSLNVDPTKTAVEPAIASVGGTPYDAWEEFNGVNQIRVKRWDGSAWTSVGGALNADPTKAAFTPNIADVGGTPYVTWEEGAVDQVHVKKWDGAAWADVGGVVNVDPSDLAADPWLASIAGAPYIAWREDAGSVEQVHVARLSGSSWTAVGGVLNLDPTKDANEPSIASIGGTPYVVWDDESNGGDEVRIARWTGSAWSLVGDALNPGESSFGPVPRIADVGGAPSVAWSEPGSVDLVRVSQFPADVPGQQPTTALPAASPVTTPGPTPAPAPKPAAVRTTIACKAAKRKVTCSVKLAAARSGAVRVALRRGSVTVASGAGRLSRGSAKLKLSARKLVKPGRYTLVIKAGKATIATTAVRIGR
jgi:hypothetical protein